MCSALDTKRPNLPDIVRILVTRLYASEYRGNAKHKLLRAERLGQIVVSAHAEAFDSVAFLAARRQHQHRDAGSSWICPQLFHHFEARQSGQHQVEHDYRRLFSSSSGQTFRSARCGRDGVAGFREVVGYEGDDVGFVINDEDAVRSSALISHLRKLSAP